MQREIFYRIKLVLKRVLPIDFKVFSLYMYTFFPINIDIYWRKNERKIKSKINNLNLRYLLANNRTQSSKLDTSIKMKMI